MNGMRKLLFILMVLPFTLNVRAEDPPSMLEKAVSNIKRWEGWHRGKMPYIGFGHRLLPHEKLTENLNTLLGAVVKAKPAAAKGQYIRSCVVASTMGPGVKMNTAKI